MGMFSNEFRARLSFITSPSPSSICLSKARIESMLTSRPILDPKNVRCYEMLRSALTYIENNGCPWPQRAGVEVEGWRIFIAGRCAKIKGGS